MPDGRGSTVVVAAFLSLALGVAVGYALAPAPLATRAEWAVARLEQNYARLRADRRLLEQRVRDLTATLSSNQAFLRVAEQTLVAGRLAGYRVLVLGLGEAPVEAELIGALEDARAEVSAVAGWRAQAADWTDWDEVFLAPGVTVRGQLSGPPDAVVVRVSGAAPASALRLLVDSLAEAGVTVALAARSDERLAWSASFFKSWPPVVSSVDDVDRPEGRVALVLALEGHPGNWGTRPPAERVLPELD